MNKNFISAKLQLPQLGDGIVARSRLLSEMAAYRDKKATCVIAPAGYGKTVFIHQFVTCSNLPCVWYQLDDFDNDPVQFFQYLLAGLSEHVPDFRIRVPEFNKEKVNADKIYYNLMVSIIEELEKKVVNRLIIVFDDFHLITEPEILKFMNYFLNYVSPTVHVILSCRYEPNLHLLRLKASGNIIEINQEKLEFTLSEIEQLYCVENEQYPTKEFIQSINSLLKGWALGLSVIKLVFNNLWIKIDNLKFFEAKTEIFNYFSDELFDSLPQDIQEFLQITSVLEFLTPDSCNYMLGIQNSATILKYIKKRNLFVVATSSEENVSYRYHHLFREFLINLLGNKRTENFIKAGRYYLENGRYEQAVNCFISAGEDTLLAETIERTGDDMLQQGRLRTVERWLSVLENKGFVVSPKLVLLKGELLSYEGNFREAEIWIDKAFSLLKEAGDKEGQFIAAIHKARIIRYSVSFSASYIFIDKFLSEIGNYPSKYLLELLTEKVYSLWLSGNILEAVKVAKQALKKKESTENKHALLRLFYNRAILYYLQGDYTAALDFYRQILNSNENSKDILEQDSIHLYMACIYRDRGNPQEAMEILERSAERKNRTGFFEDLHLIYFNMGLTAIDLKDVKSFERYNQLAIEEFRKTGGSLDYYESFLKALSCTLKAYLHNEASPEAELLMQEAVKSLQGKTDYLLVFVSPYFVCYYLKNQKYAEAKELLDITLPLSKKMGTKFLNAALNALRVGLPKAQDSETELLQFVRRSLSLSAREGYMRYFLTYPEFIPCLKAALLNNIETKFVEELIVRSGSHVVPMLTTLLGNSNTAVRKRAVRLLGQIGTSEVQQIAAMLFFDPDSLVRESGVALYQKLGTKTGTWPFKLFVKCIGRLKVYYYTDLTNPLSWRTEKAKEIFAYFLHWKDQSVSTEKILADIWPDMDVEKARNLFHTNLSFVKKFLKQYGLEGTLKKSQMGYSLDTSNIVCDLWMAEGYSALKTGVEEKQIFQEVIRLNSYLEDIYSDWPQEKRERLQKRTESS